MMGLFGNATKHVSKAIDRKLDQLSMCPSCRHKAEVSGCTCRRNDCMCMHFNKGKKK